MKIKEFFLHKSSSKRSFRRRIHSLLWRAELTSFTVSNACGSGIDIEVRK